MDTHTLFAVGKTQLFFLTLFICCAPFSPSKAQSIEDYGVYALDRELDFYFQAKLFFNENERRTEETNYSDVHQKRSRKGAKADFKLYMFYADGEYDERFSKTEVDEKHTEMSGIKTDSSQWIELFDLIYLWSQQKSDLSDYSSTEKSILKFEEKERAFALSQGLGLVFDQWRVGVAPLTHVDWSYQVNVENQPVIDEQITFYANVLVLVRTTQDYQGPFYELGVKNWVSKNASDNRNGTMTHLNGFIVLGSGFSDGSIIYIMEKRSRGTITTELLSDQSDATRHSTKQKSIFGLRYYLFDTSYLFVEQKTIQREITFNNTSFSHKKELFESQLTVGIGLNESVEIELTTGDFSEKRVYTERVISNKTSYYKQSDRMVGISINLRFSS